MKIAGGKGLLVVVTLMIVAFDVAVCRSSSQLEESTRRQIAAIRASQSERRTRTAMEMTLVLNEGPVAKVPHPAHSLYVEVSDTDAAMPDPTLTGWTTREPDGLCLIHLRLDHTEDDTVLAHEVCHCELHYKMIDDRGFTTRNPVMVQKLEMEASACGGLLLGDWRRYRDEMFR